MNIYNLNEKLIFCHACNAPVKYGIDTYYYGDDLRCLIDNADKDKGAHLGFSRDIPKEWRNDESHILKFHPIHDIKKDAI